MKLLITADLHLRPERPRCRLDEDWAITQMAALRQIVKYSNEYQAPLCINGDIFDPKTGKVPPWVETLFLRQISKAKYGVFILAGNHDLPNHSWNKVNESSFGVIWNSGKVSPLSSLGLAAHFGQPLEGTNTNLVFLHQLVFASAGDIPPTEKAITASDLLEEYPKAKWIFTGDMHRNFHYEENGRHVVNPGCMLRQTIAFKDYQPQVYLVDLETEEVISLPILDTVEMVKDSYVKEEDDRKDRVESFIQMVRSAGTVSLDFRSNLEVGMELLDQETSDMVYSLLEEVDKK
jgi:hypothetical protein